VGPGATAATGLKRPRAVYAARRLCLSRRPCPGGKPRYPRWRSRNVTPQAPHFQG
jgi:hypothetical protein